MSDKHCLKACASFCELFSKSVIFIYFSPILF
nr:MAG TPA: hypothetical protein [Caudoviricetes sp.]